MKSTCFDIQTDGLYNHCWTFHPDIGHPNIKAKPPENYGNIILSGRNALSINGSALFVSTFRHGAIPCGSASPARLARTARILGRVWFRNTTGILLWPSG